jgi:hypothetical protein
MSRIAPTTSVTLTASDIYLADYTLSEKFRCRIARFDDSYEFVADRSFESGIPANDLEIGIADAGEYHSHETFIFGFGSRNIFDRDSAIRYPQCLHTIVEYR